MNPMANAAILNTESSVIVVSGLPRSGTSLLMQMLQAAGIQTMADEKRPPDTHNPNGYLELERVKHLAADNTWLRAATGMAVKVIVQLIPFLPTGIPYKILFVNRDLNEIIQSQERMLVAHGSGHLVSKEIAPVLELMFQGAIEFAKHQPFTQFMVVEHRDLISRPMESSHFIRAFLENPRLDVSAMAAVVDPCLHRNRRLPNLGNSR